jgi:hypothetical protein
MSMQGGIQSVQDCEQRWIRGEQIAKKPQLPLATAKTERVSRSED